MFVLVSFFRTSEYFYYLYYYWGSELYRNIVLQVDLGRLGLNVSDIFILQVLLATTSADVEYVIKD